MKLEFENRLLRLENAEGLRWQVTDAEKPEFSFGYDALLVNEQHALRRTSQGVAPLTDGEIAEVVDYVMRQTPPPSVTLQKQSIADLRAFAHGLINSVIAQLEYDGLLDVMITGRDGSTDLYAEEARRVLSYVDSVWNAFHGLAARIGDTPTAELRPLKEYAEMMPFPPSTEYFFSGLHPGLFDAKGSAG
jgi:hypothetical protein